MNDLFANAALGADGQVPLAERLRPKDLNEVIGQEQLLGPDRPLARMLKAGRISSAIFWGPPGSGKTTMARLVAAETGYHFEQISAVFSGVADLRKVFEAAKLRRNDGINTLLFVDEIHRFNRAQQDGFLPYVENGTITLFGATTENPSFELNAALLSRCQVLLVNRLDETGLRQLLERAEALCQTELPLQPDARLALLAMADGDGRFLLNLCEDLFDLSEATPLDVAGLRDAVQRRSPVYDKSQDGHFNLISALHKTLRGSDADASLYWLARMLVAGEDPLYITRRLVRFAVEDIGLADPQAVVQALSAKDAYDFLGSPEGELAIAQAVLYLATAPKSNAGYKAYKLATRAARDTGSLVPPKSILNAPTTLMKDLGYGADYQYDHDAAGGFSGQDYFPDGMGRRTFYEPLERGFEREVAKRLNYWQRLRQEKQGAGEGFEKTPQVENDKT